MRKPEVPKHDDLLKILRKPERIRPVSAKIPSSITNPQTFGAKLANDDGKGYYLKKQTTIDLELLPRQGNIGTSGQTSTKSFNYDIYAPIFEAPLSPAESNKKVFTRPSSKYQKRPEIKKKLVKKIRRIKTVRPKTCELNPDLI